MKRCGLMMRFAFLFLQFVFIFAQVEESSSSSYPQVPVCAPISPVGTQGSQVWAQKGDQGVPGKRGATGVAGRDGVEGRVGATGSKGERGFPGYLWGSGGCPGVTFHLPRDNQVTDYVRHRAYFPSMTEATACMWLEVGDFTGHPSPMSYAVPTPDNEWNLIFRNSSRISTYIRANEFRMSIPRLQVAQKYHICTWFSSKRRQYALYINAIRRIMGDQSGDGIRGDGDLILGQEQDLENAGGLDSSQSYSGNITNFMIWPRVLTDEEISNIARNCDCPWDYSVAMTMDKAELHGEAHYSRYDECPTL